MAIFFQERDLKSTSQDNEFIPQQDGQNGVDAQSTASPLILPLQALKSFPKTPRIAHKGSTLTQEGSRPKTFFLRIIRC